MDMPGMRDSEMVAFQGTEHQRPLIASRLERDGEGWCGSPGHHRAFSSGVGGTKIFLQAGAESRAAPASLGSCWQDQECWTWAP